MQFKTPPQFEVLQSPHVLPPIFSGEKLVVYGILKNGSAPNSDIKGMALLTGVMVGKKISHSVSFKFNPATDAAPVLPTIHHLAAKALLKDWQDENKSKTDIIKLSVESSVISSHTAFIAVDEESSEVVSGAMKTWDIQAQRQMDYRVTGISSYAYDCDSESDDECEDLSLEGGALMTEFSASGSSITYPSSLKSAAPPPLKQKSSGFSFGGLFSGFLGSKRKRIYCGEERFADDFSPDDMPSLQAAPTPLAHKPKPAAPTNTLSAIISLQLANGSWQLNSGVVSVLNKTQKGLEEACPGECQGVVAAVWATVLVLTLLRSRFADEQDEWELVGSKAESWVKKQSLPAALTLDSLYSAAQKVLA